MCVLLVFSGRALTVVLQKIIITNTFYDLILHWNLCGDLKANFSIGFMWFCAIHPLDLYRSEADFVVVYVKTVIRDHSNAIFQFSSRTLKTVRTFLDRGSVTTKQYLPS